eukprot:SAG11_NODE_5425_length_1564_cov_1.347440_2_plen_192_part_01
MELQNQATGSNEMYCGMGTSLDLDEPTCANELCGCLRTIGRQAPLLATGYSTSLSISQKCFVGQASMARSYAQLDLFPQERVNLPLLPESQAQQSYFHGLPGQIWYLPTPPEGTPSEPLLLSITNVTLNPFYDFIEVLLLPRTEDTLEDMFTSECYSKRCGDDITPCTTINEACSDGSTCLARGKDYRGNQA